MVRLSARVELALIGALLVVAALVVVDWQWLLLGGCRIPPRVVAEGDARELRSAVQRWRGLRATHECPDQARLVLDGEIDAATHPGDPWGKPFWIRCLVGDDDVLVTSAGPDGLDGNDDDIVVPRGLPSSLSAPP